MVVYAVQNRHLLTCLWCGVSSALFYRIMQGGVGHKELMSKNCSPLLQMFHAVP